MVIYSLIGVLLIIFSALILLIFRLARAKEDVILHQKIDSLKEEFTKNILQSQSHFLDSSKAVSDDLNKLYEKIGNLTSDSQQILNLTKSFQDILKPTKTRGILGEVILENLLRDVLPQGSVINQYGFKDGKRVDFAIKLPAAIVPIDAKFSMEVFKSYFDAPPDQKDRSRRICIDSIKKRILETSAYIYPDEGTTDFALMYVPSEAVYYFIITETELLEAAHQKKIFIVGPNTLYAYLKTISIGFKAMNIEKKAKEIYNNLKRLEKEILIFEREYKTLGSHIKSSSSKYEELNKRIEDISSKLRFIDSQDNDSQS